MSYTAPTIADLQTRYPAFASVADATIQYWLDDAADGADNSWPDATRFKAVQALAAHRMAINGIGDGAAAASGLTRFKSGSVEMTFSTARADAAGWAQTIYGQEYYSYLRSVKAGPRTAYGAVATGCPC